MRGAGALLLAALAACGEAPEPAPQAPRPTRDLDVVLIVIDTLRADRVGAWGHARPTTPVIDLLAARGARCADATAQSSWTAPSMVSLFQSRHVSSDFVKMPEGPTLAERLRAAGYRTAAFQDNVLLAPGHGFERGFDSYEMEMGPVAYRAALGAHDGRPLFAYFHFVDPHDPYAPEPAFDLFPPQPPDPALRQRFADYLRALEPQTPEAERAARVEAALAQVARERALYEGDVRQADKRVDFVLGLLAETGRLERSLIVLTADHGECLWDHREALGALAEADRGDLLKAFKRTHNTLLTQELVHVPLLLAGPGVPAGVVVPGPVENVDIVPTILDALGLPRPPELQGRSLLPEIAAAAGGTPAPGRELVVANTALFTAVRARDGRKLIVPWNAAGPDVPAAFRLADDPRELAPLDAGDPAFDDLRRALQSAREAALASRRGEDVVDDETRRRLQALGYAGR